MAGGLKILTVINDFSRYCAAIEADTSIPGGPGCAGAGPTDRGSLPQVIVTDNGPEFTSKAFDRWAYEHKVRLDLIRPGKPVENAFIEDECLNEHWFVNLKNAKEKIKAWRRDYNGSRPLSSLGNLTPEEIC